VNCIADYELDKIYRSSPEFSVVSSKLHTSASAP
jgi:hypothetical protein